MRLLLPRIYTLGSERLLQGLLCPKSLALVAPLFLPCGSSCTELAHPVLQTVQHCPAPLSPGSQQHASLWPAFLVHIPVSTVGAIGSWQVAGKEAFGSLLAAAGFSLPSVARRTENSLYPSCAEEIKPISPALPMLLQGPSGGPGYLEVNLPLMTAP